jgi:hypothetical protein
MKNAITIVLVFIISALNAQEPNKAQFDSLLVRAKIDFTMPKKCNEVAVEFMRKIPHNYAVGPKDKSFQIRYWVRPLDTWFADYNKKSKKEKTESMHPDALCKSMMMLAVLDASNNQSTDYLVSQFPELVKEAYNADWSATALLESGWPQEGYKYCYITSLHKDGAADIYITVLADKQEDFFKVTELMAKSIKFQ